MNYKEYIDKYLTIFENNYKVSTPINKRIPFDKVIEMLDDLDTMLDEYFIKEPIEASKMSIGRVIPFLKLMIKLDKKNVKEYLKYLKNAYRMASRTSLEHYFIYREWEVKKKDKFFSPRYEILRGYVHYLEEIATNPNFQLLIANLPSGYGKTYTEKISEAWNFGIDHTGTVLSLCSNDNVVKSGSKTVRDEMKSEWFGDVFNDIRWSKEKNKELFIKETDSEWKLRDCKLAKSYVASTVQSNVVGERASQRIHLDDLYPNHKEAMNQTKNEDFFNNYTTVWNKRFIQNAIPKIVVTGTLWATGDFIHRLIVDAMKNHEFKKSTKYKYVWVSEDETMAIVRVPALDYETGLSTCPELRTTAQIEEERRKIPEFLFQTNFQQKPTDPESLMFSWTRLRTYDHLPLETYKGTYAVIDATRKTGRDYFSMPIFQRNDEGEEELMTFYLKDCIYTQKATKDLYYDICNKIIEHHITHLVIESNVTSELAQNIESILKQNNVTYCEIGEKYQNENKEARIIDQSHNILKRIVFPLKENTPIQSDMGEFMNTLTTYNSKGRNEHDDAPDSLGLATSEFIEEKSQGGKVIPLKRVF